MAQEHCGEYPSLLGAIESIAPKIGSAPQTLHAGSHRRLVDTGVRDGVTSDERERVEALEREVKDLQRSKEILNPAGFLAIALALQSLNFFVRSPWVCRRV